MDSFYKLLFSFTIFFQVFLTFAIEVDTIQVNQTIRDGQTIVSPQESFELGFFSPSNTSENRYLAIWYKRLATGTIVWVANRETPIKNKSGELILDTGGVLVLRDSGTKEVFWRSTSSKITRNPVARLLENGNLMVIDSGNEPEDYIWQTFDNPGDTELPEMKFGGNFERGIVTNFTSWKSIDDPSHGLITLYMDFDGLPQIFLKKGDVIQNRLGSWNGIAYTGRPNVKQNPFFELVYVSNEKELYTKFILKNDSVLSKLRLTPEGNLDRYIWINRTQGWILLSTPTSDVCARYSLCGIYGSCEMEKSPPCGCLKGFTPKRQYQWDLADWSDGCEREIRLDCGVKEGFRKYSYMKLPDTRKSWFDRIMNIEQCKVKCKSECNCTAYATLDIKYGTGCLLWYDELIDLRSFPDGAGQDIYIRMAAAELEKDIGVSKSKKKITTIVIISVIVGLAISLGLCFLIFLKRKMKLNTKGSLGPVSEDNVSDLPLFGMSTLLSATNNFSDNNKLGEGGFGPVYKGLLEDGSEIAVKRLSLSSTQGDEEFKNEMIFISKVQHRNLVKILGCCIEGDEKMLVYEYMPNKGLDLFLFQEPKTKILDWSQRFHIINGIARGLLYLHQDSRLRIIHRDLKAANVLLDHDMNPKISDFGLARGFGGNDTETNTTRVVGTYGYMSPEYAGDGVFSIKSDVFSFGVLVLEIVSGKKNRRFFHQAHDDNLLGHAWRLYNEGKKTLELVDELLIESSDMFEILRSIHVALLCVQHSPEDRPDMSLVVMMLSSEGRLPEPRQPGFYMDDEKFGPESSYSMRTQISNNNVSITRLEPR